ncbi:MAG: DUF4296 domain-containing protein [Candidatus Cryptobacteroides sp.]|nr:DUF4296 domain-containing protein [Bacteroidales bacterium]MDY5743225.1 DUF4296 domain-containing protein [Candidatus Cryptobacteroides sp.]
MKRRHLRIAIIILAVVLLGIVPTFFMHRNGRVIPRNKMARIYAEMLLTDQWINDNWVQNRSADTSFVYRPILRRYGYDEKDWRKSVSKYIKDPDRYSRILKKSAAMLEAREKELRFRLDLINAAERLEQETAGFIPERLYWLAGMRNPDNFVEDGLVFYVDSVGGSEWRFDPYRGYDTLFAGPAWKISLRDSVSVDSLSVSVDSLLVDVDSLSVSVDSLSVGVDSIAPVVAKPAEERAVKKPAAENKSATDKDVKKPVAGKDADRRLSVDADRNLLLRPDAKIQ